VGKNEHMSKNGHLLWRKGKMFFQNASFSLPAHKKKICHEGFLSDHGGHIPPRLSCKKIFLQPTAPGHPWMSKFSSDAL
jgi:hypothetical protein